MALLLFNCNTDDSVVNNATAKTQNTNAVQVKQVSLEDIKDITKLDNTINKIAKAYTLVSKTTKANKASKTSNSNNSFTILTDQMYQAVTATSEAYTFKIETPLNPDATFENFIIEKRANQEAYHYYIYSYKTIDLQDGTAYHVLIDTKKMIDMENANMLSARVAWFGQCLYRVDEITGLPKQVVWCTGSGDSGGGGFGGNGSTSGNVSNHGAWLYHPNENGGCNRTRIVYVYSDYEANMTSNYGGSYNGHYITETEYGVECLNNNNGENSNTGNNTNTDNVNDPHFNDGPETGETGGGGTSSPNPWSNPDTSTVVTIPVIPYEDQVINCLSTYVLTTGNTSIQAWLDTFKTDSGTGSSKNVNLKALANYLDEQGCSAESQEFAVLAIEAMDDDGEVDFEDKIINELTGKALCIYNKLNSSSTSFKNAIKKFEPDFPVAHLKFDMGDIEGSKARAIPPNSNPTTPNSPDFVITIRLNNNDSSNGITKRPNLLVAKTIAHEVIHAEMFRKLLSVLDNGGNITGVTRQDVLNALDGNFPGMYDYFMRHKNWQHQQMATHYRETLARILQKYDTGLAVPDNQQPAQLYLDLSWEGLIYENGDNAIYTWTSLPEDEKVRIEGVISTYIEDNLNENCIE